MENDAAKLSGAEYSYVDVPDEAEMLPAVCRACTARPATVSCFAQDVQHHGLHAVLVLASFARFGADTEGLVVVSKSKGVAPRAWCEGVVHAITVATRVAAGRGAFK